MFRTHRHPDIVRRNPRARLFLVAKLLMRRARRMYYQRLAIENIRQMTRQFYIINKLFYRKPIFTDRYTYEDFCGVGRFFGENFVIKRDPKYVSKIFFVNHHLESQVAMDYYLIFL